jgi:hypothetical protein
MREQNGVELEIQWGGFAEATAVSSLSRSQLYNFIRDGLIRSRVIRRKNARGAGHRLIDLNSLRAFIENSPSESPAEVRARNRAAAIAMTKAKARRREHAVDSQRAAPRRAEQREAA